VGACLDEHFQAFGIYLDVSSIGFEPIDLWNCLGVSLVLCYFGSYPVACCIVGFGMLLSFFFLIMLSFFSFIPTYLCCMLV
jgi:hypothetical protein